MSLFQLLLGHNETTRIGANLGDSTYSVGEECVPLQKALVINIRFFPTGKYLSVNEHVINNLVAFKVLRYRLDIPHA